LFAFIVIIVSGVCFFLNNSTSETEDNNETISEIKVTKKLQVIDLDSNSRPYAVMINNIKDVWGYQCGLQDAYIVYEMIVEGGYTRLMALFKDVDLERIGSVRSSRHYFLDYALENDAIYVHFGWSPQAQSDIASLNIDNINFLTSSGYFRDYSLPLATEHTAFTTTSDIMKVASNFNYRTTSDEDTLLNYSVDEIDLSTKDGAILANNVYIKYSSSRDTSFVYDSENKVYNRFQNSIAHKDYVTGLQYTAKNIIVYQVKNTTIEGDSSGRQTLDNIGSGNGYYITEGYAVPITWTKTSRSSKTVYKYLDGTEIDVNDGNTYIQIQPLNQTLTIE
jgi:hypothetical protein